MNLEELYAEILYQNPICFYYCQLRYLLPNNNLTKIFGNDSINYTEKSSLIHQFVTKELVEITENKFYLITYDIVLKISEETNDIEKGRIISLTPSINYQFYANLFAKIPTNLFMKDIQKKSIATQLNKYIHYVIKFENIPKESILLLEKKRFELNLKNQSDRYKLQTLLESEKNELINLQKKINEHPLKLKTIIEDMEKENTKNQAALDVIQKIYSSVEMIDSLLIKTQN